MTFLLLTAFPQAVRVLPLGLQPSRQKESFLFSVPILKQTKNLSAEVKSTNGVGPFRSSSRVPPSTLRLVGLVPYDFRREQTHSQSSSFTGSLLEQRKSQPPRDDGRI